MNVFTLGRIGDTRDTHFGHGGVRGQHFFDFARPDLVSAALDEILLAIDEKELAVLVEISQVAGM